MKFLIYFGSSINARFVTQPLTLGASLIFGSSFSTSASLLAINSEITSNPISMSMESNVKNISNASQISPDGAWYEIILTSMHNPEFWEEFQTFILNALTSGRTYGLLLQPRNQTGVAKTLGVSFKIDSSSSLEDIKNYFLPILQTMEDDYNESFDLETRVKIRDLTSPQQQSPKTSQASILQAIRESNLASKSLLEAFKAQGAAQAEASKTLLEAIKAQGAAMTEALKANQTQLNWTPLIQAVATAIPAVVGVPVQVSAPTPAPAPTHQLTAPAEAQVHPSVQATLEALNNSVANQGKTLEALTANLTTLSSTVINQSKTLEALTTTVAQQGKILETLTKLVIPTAGLLNGSPNGSSSNPPAAPAAPSSPASPSSPTYSPGQLMIEDLDGNLVPAEYEKFPGGGLKILHKPSSPLTGNSNQMLDDLETAKKVGGKALHTSAQIKPAKPYEKPLDLTRIVTADLESLITKEGLNQVFMAAWYNGKEFQVFDICQFGHNPQTMLVQFWLSLIRSCKGCTVYFHNWAGYDSILSMASLVSLHKLGYAFEPVLQKGRVICLTVKKDNHILLTIKDSILIIPGALGRLAKDFKVDTQKDHFPHYFNPLELYGTLDWSGALPEYSYFEPKRTTPLEYDEMKREFQDKPWSFLEVSKSYIQGDVIALYQILVEFFVGLKEKFPINPIQNLSAPGIAFTTWKTLQLPELNRQGLKVYDFSQSYDASFREGYLGGIVDVYKPHLTGRGYYYDVNSLYPTAMTYQMPVGVPVLTTLTPDQFSEGDFFGFVKARVQAPENQYIGLLPVRLAGRLVCPIGVFDGFFFSEELRFALQKGYKILYISLAYQFEKGKNCFKDLIIKLNDIKIQAQAENKPALRNIAKLLMNSMYGRFGMHVDNIAAQLVSIGKSREIMDTYQVTEVLNLGTMDLVCYVVKPSLYFNSKDKRFLKSKHPIPGQTNVALAAAITAYSRIIINQHKLAAMENGLEVYYSDTDSLVLNGPLPSEYIDGAKLGYLKLEHVLEEAYFVAPKMYWLLTEKGVEVSKCKGYPGSLTKDQVVSLYKGETLNLLTSKWSRDLGTGQVRIHRGVPYKLGATLNKREKVFNSEGVWVDTKPLILGQGIPESSKDG